VAAAPEQPAGTPALQLHIYYTVGETCGHLPHEAEVIQERLKRGERTKMRTANPGENRRRATEKREAQTAQKAQTEQTEQTEQERQESLQQFEKERMERKRRMIAKETAYITEIITSDDSEFDGVVKYYYDHRPNRYYYIPVRQYLYLLFTMTNNFGGVVYMNKGDHSIKIHRLFRLLKKIENSSRRNLDDIVEIVLPSIVRGREYGICIDEFLDENGQRIKIQATRRQLYRLRAGNPRIKIDYLDENPTPNILGRIAGRLKSVFSGNHESPKELTDGKQGSDVGDSTKPDNASPDDVGLGIVIK